MFYIKRKVKKGKFISISELSGLTIKPNTKKSELKINNILICDKELKNKYIKKQLDKKFSKMYKKIYKYLIDSDDSEEGVKACLGEIEKIKAIIFNKYKEHMKNKLYKEYLAKIVLTENEFRNKLMEKQYYETLINKAMKSYNRMYEEEMEKGRSR